MTTTGWVIAIGYSVVTIIGVALVLIVFRSTRVGFHVRVASRESLEKREGYWGLAVVTVLVGLLAATMFSLPYWGDDEAEAEQTVEITGRQFAFTVDPTEIQAGVETQVQIHSADVNHAVGLYDPDGVLIKQVNVLPGVNQEFRMTFDEPGTYEVLCLEFCGLDHHLMKNKLRVSR